MTTYPTDSPLLVRTGRFLNILDPDVNALSPVKIQAWLSTVQMLGVGLNDFLTHHTDAVQTTAALVWAGLAHTAHQFDKVNRAKSLALIGGGK